MQGFETDTMPYLNRKKQRRSKHIEKSKTHVVQAGLRVSHSGTSVNPSHEDHQAALQQAHERDVKERAEWAAIHAALQPAPLSGPIAQAPPEWDDESEIITKKKAKRALSKAERNRQKRIAAKKREQEKAKKEKSFLKQLGRVEIIQKEVAKQERKKQQEKEKIEHLKATQPDRRPRLGKHKFEEAHPEVPLTEELKGSLRETKTSVHGLRDQFKRFQEKNMIPTTIKQKKRNQGNFKYYKRTGFKTTDLNELDENSREDHKRHQKYSRKRRI